MRPRSLFWAGSLALLFSATAWANLPGVDRLQQIMTAEHAGSITRVFHGPDDLTGVIIKHGQKTAIGYISTNGKYFFLGMLMNLRNGVQYTQQDTVKYLRNKGIIVGYRAAESIALANSLPAVTYGPLQYKDNTTLICNPSTAVCQTAILDMIHIWQKDTAGNPKLRAAFAFRFLPLGQKAAWILSAPVGLPRQKRVQALFRNQYPGTVTNAGTQKAGKIQNAVRNFPVVPPLVIMDMPNANIYLVTSAKHAEKTLHHSSVAIRGAS